MLNVSMANALHGNILLVCFREIQAGVLVLQTVSCDESAAARGIRNVSGHTGGIDLTHRISDDQV